MDSSLPMSRLYSSRLNKKMSFPRRVPGLSKFFVSPLEIRRIWNIICVLVLSNSVTGPGIGGRPALD